MNRDGAWEAVKCEIVLLSEMVVQKDSFGSAILKGGGVDFTSGDLAYELSGKYNRRLLRIFDSSGNIDAFGIRALTNSSGTR